MSNKQINSAEHIFMHGTTKNIKTSFMNTIIDYYKSRKSDKGSVIIINPPKEWVNTFNNNKDFRLVSAKNTTYCDLEQTDNVEKTDNNKTNK